MQTSNLEDMNMADILDRVLDKGIVIDPSARVSLMGQDLHAMRSRVVVESVNTFF
jgi:gas vesicle structural protein